MFYYIHRKCIYEKIRKFVNLKAKTYTFFYNTVRDVILKFAKSVI
jgi:hypothetical protein